MTRRDHSIVAALDPACFSIVMATGIVSLACWHHGASDSWLHGMSTLLLWGNLLAFVLLTGLTVCRVLSHPRRMIDDLRYWGMVFPLGMYCVATHAASRCFGISFLDQASIAFLYVALATWLITSIGLVRTGIAAIK